MQTPGQVRRRYYAMVLLYNLSASLIWGVNTLFLLDAGLDLFETFVANAFFTAGQVLFEIPTGVAADTVGRRFSFLTSAAILAVATLAYVLLAELGAGIVLFSIASVLLGLGFTFYSGATEAWVVDALKAAGDKGAIDTVFARGGQLFGVSLIVGTVAGGFLGQLDLSLPYLVRAGLLVALFGVAWWGMHDIGFERRPFRIRQVPREMGRITRASIQHGLKNAPVRLVMLMTLLHMGFLIWGWYAWQPYFLDLLGQDLIWVAGLIAAGLGVIMVLGGQVAAALGGKVRRSTAVAVAATVFSIGMVLTGLLDSFWPVVGVFFVGMAAFAVAEPFRQAALHACIPSETRATVVSFNSLMGSAGGVVSQPALGAYTRSVGIGPGYVVGGVVTAPVVLLALLLRRHSHADRRPVDDEGKGGLVPPGTVPPESSDEEA